MQLRRLFNTIRHLKARQMYYQVLYRLKKPGALAVYQVPVERQKVKPLQFAGNLKLPDTASADGTFKFLNRPVSFGNVIDWNFLKEGKLWNYNLQYADYLLQENIPVTTRLTWLRSLHQALLSGNTPLEPYPVSLRSINTIRFLSRHSINDADLQEALYAQLRFLASRVEYNILGNHLLENGFALIMGGAYFNDSELLTLGQHILSKELEEQILPDGGHFERSPMYHKIIFFRVLELRDWYRNFEGSSEKFGEFIYWCAVKMYGWLKSISFKNGDIPHFNDSADGITYTTKELLDYAALLGVQGHDNIDLRFSGYRKQANEKYEFIVDIGGIEPSYQPGHAHADTFSFYMHVKGKPVFVERGTSTYQPGSLRNEERGTSSHNTVVCNGKDQSEVWGGFRVGRRARVKIYSNEPGGIEAMHDGYRYEGFYHKRTFRFEEERVVITDTDSKGRTQAGCQSYLHLHPDVSILKIGVSDYRIGDVKVNFAGAVSIHEQQYQFSTGFNQTRQAILLKIEWDKALITTIDIL